MASLRVTLVDKRGKNRKCVVLKERDWGGLMSAASAKLKIRVTRLYLQQDGTPVSPEMLPNLANGKVLIGSAGPLGSSSSSSRKTKLKGGGDDWRLEGMDQKWRDLLGPHLIDISSSKSVAASTMASHAWLAHEKDALYFDVPAPLWPDIERRLDEAEVTATTLANGQKSSGPYLHYVYHGRPRRFQLDVDASPIDLVEVARTCQVALKSEANARLGDVAGTDRCDGASGGGADGGDVSCSVALSPRVGERAHWGHITFPFIIATDDDDHNYLKASLTLPFPPGTTITSSSTTSSRPRPQGLCVRAMQKAWNAAGLAARGTEGTAAAAAAAAEEVPASLSIGPTDWNHVIDRAHCASLRCHGSDKWDERDHVAMGRPLVKYATIDGGGVVTPALQSGWYCPLIYPVTAGTTSNADVAPLVLAGPDAAPRPPRAADKAHFEVSSHEELRGLLDRSGQMARVRLLLLSGLPATGKTTFSSTLSGADGRQVGNDDQWVVVSSDELRSRKKCEAAARAALRREATDGASFVRVCVDRCNQTTRHRSEFVQLGRNCGLAPDEMAIVHFHEPRIETCISRAIKRVGHPTLNAATDGAEAVERVVRRFGAEYQPPNAAEGVGTVVKVVGSGWPQGVDDAQHGDEGGAAEETEEGERVPAIIANGHQTPLQQLLVERGIHKFVDVKAALEGDDIDVRVKEHPKMNSLYMPMYYRIGATFGRQGGQQSLLQRVVDGCRGAIYEKGTNKLVCAALDKFWEHDHPLAASASIDWSTAVVTEKLDGSLVKLFSYQGEWFVASNGCLDAYSAVIPRTSPQKTVGGIFDEAMSSHPEFSLERLDRNHTYLFELCSPHNRVVVFHDRSSLTHLVTYASATGKEVADSDGIGVPRPKRVLTTSLESTLSLAATLCSQEEGFVVADSAGNRIKVKGKDYCKVHSNPARFDALWFHALSFYLQPPPSKEMREGVLRSVPGIAVVLEWLEATLVPDLTLLSERLSYDLKLEAELMKHPEKTVSFRQSHGKAPRALRNVKSVWDKALSLKLRGALADQGCIDITGAQLLQLARPRPASAGAGAGAGATVVDSNEVRSVMKELILNHVASVSKKAKILNATSGFSITQLRKLKRGH